MSEVLDNEVAWLTGLTSEERASALAHLIHKLTVAGRCLIWSEGADAVRLERVRQLNEVQHRVAGYLIHALKGDEDTGWIRVVVAYVLGAADEQVRRQCHSAWADVRTYRDAARHGPPGAPSSAQG
jgi:hypothetical protein